MSEGIYPISEVITYSDGSTREINFKLPETEITEDEIDAQIASEEIIETPVDEDGNALDPFTKEAEEAPVDSVEELA